LLSLFVAGKIFLAVSGNLITDRFARNNSFAKKINDVRHTLKIGRPNNREK
jgi:hypothetical protein